MNWKQLLNRKSMETLEREMAGEHRLRRALGPVQLTALAIGAIIGAGIFVMTGRVAAQDAGPAVLISFLVAGFGCALAALCYAEFAAMVPVAGSAYTYAYATLGELFAWIIGWDLILEYGMSCATVAASWSGYLDSFLWNVFGCHVPEIIASDPFTSGGASLFNLPAVGIMLIVTVILVVGIRESASTNAVLVGVKLAVVLFVIFVGWSYVSSHNWTGVSPNQRVLAEPGHESDKWGLLGLVGLNHVLAPIDDHFRSSFAPYGLSGIMLGAALVFFAYIGFDSISTNAEEAKNPQRDLPIGIIASLIICTILYIAMAAVITGMEPYPSINPKAAVSAAFQLKAEQTHSSLLKASAALIAIGALAGMTSVLLVTFLSQARIFLAMARDRLLPQSVFGAIHPRFQTPHRATMLTGLVVCVIAGLTPINKLEEMVNIGTMMAFVFVCAAVLLMRIRRPEIKRPFSCPLVYVVAPLGIFVNLLMTLFLPLDTWIRLVVWLLAGWALYFTYGHRHSLLGVASRVLHGRESYRHSLEALATHYEQLAAHYVNQADKLDKELAQPPAESQGDEEDRQRKQLMVGEYRRLVAQYHGQRQNALNELNEYDARVPKPHFDYELPVAPAPALLHQLRTQGASPTDGPLETVNESGDLPGVGG